MRKIIIPIAGLFFLCFFLFLNVYHSNADGNLLAYWKLDETTAGSTVIDSSGNSFSGTPHGNPQPSTDVPSTITFYDPESLNFDGSQWVSVPDNSAFAMTSATFSVWVKFTNTSAGDMDMIAKRSSDGSQVQWQFGYNAGGNQFKVSLANGGNSCCRDFDWSPGSPLTVNTWYNIAVVIDGTHNTLTWYQNGVSQATDNISGHNLGTEIPADLTLGASYDGNSEFLQGYLDDVRIYNTALTSDQIADIASGDSGPGVPAATPTPGPTSVPAPGAQLSSSSNSTPMPSAPVCSAQMPSGTPDLFQIDSSDTYATLYFSPVNNPVSNYYVSYGYSSGDERFGTLTNQGVSLGVLSYTINDLLPDTTYYFRIRPQNDCMPGDWGNEMEITTTKENSANTIRYYKDLISQILSVFSEQTTNLSSSITKHINNGNQTSPCEYSVKAGDSLWNIAQLKLGSGFDFQKIEKENNLSSALLYAGQTLKVNC